MKLKDLKIGHNYLIKYIEGKTSTANYEGIGKLVAFDPPGYPKDCLEFSIPGEIATGVFKIEDIVGAAPSDYDYLLKDLSALTHPSYHTLNDNHHRLLHAVLCAYAKHHLNRDEIGWTQLSDILCNAICEEIGDVEYCGWMDMMRSETNGGEIL